MKIHKVLIGTVLVVFAAILSVSLAIVSEGIALQHSSINGTPGLYIAGLVLPPSAGGPLSKQFCIEISIDATLWFLTICVGVFAFTKWRRGTSARSKGDESKTH
jgi:hypothetical protein